MVRYNILVKLYVIYSVNILSNSSYYLNHLYLEERVRKYKVDWMSQQIILASS